jgi:hypothetical protein
MFNVMMVVVVVVMKYMFGSNLLAFLECYIYLNLTRSSGNN